MKNVKIPAKKCTCTFSGGACKMHLEFAKNKHLRKVNAN